MFKQNTEQISIVDTLTIEQKNSFLNGCQIIILPIGFELWRFISNQADKRFGSFWLDSQTMDTIMRTLHYSGNFSQANKKNNIRDNLAILKEWSNVNWRQQIKLRKEVIAYVGKTGPQKNFKLKSNDLPFGGGAEIQQVIETRIGSQTQYIIPRFKNLQNNNEWALLSHFAHV